MALSITGIGCVGITASGERRDLFDDEFGGPLTVADAVSILRDRISGLNCYADCDRFEIYDFKASTSQPQRILRRISSDWNDDIAKFRTLVDG